MEMHDDRDDLVSAFNEGKDAGYNEDRWAGECPYEPHDNLALRDEWMKGFSAGRKMIAEMRPKLSFYRDPRAAPRC